MTLRLVTATFAWASILLAFRIAYFQRFLGLAEGLFMIITYEINRWRATTRQEKSPPPISDLSEKEVRSTDSPAYVACCIGYQEDPAIFARCLQTYRETTRGCALMVVALDGTIQENQPMYDELLRQFPDNHTSRTEILEVALSERLEELFDTQCRNTSTKASGNVDIRKCRDESFNQLCREIKARLASKIVSLKSTKSLPVLVVSQPHQGMKPIRLTGWLVSVLAAEVLNVDFIWSSDSDTYVAPGCIDMSMTSLARFEGAAGACSAMAIRDPRASLINRVYSGFCQAVIPLQRSCASAGGKLTCVAGACACYRATVLRAHLAEWYLYRCFGKRMVSLHMVMVWKSG